MQPMHLKKFRHESLTRSDVFDSHVPLEITIDVDEKKKTLTITDTGIGMTREELEHNLGTIAHSGSNTFIAELAEAAKKDISLIGQFGVGFYAAFMAGKRVRVQSRSWDESQGNEWVSDGSGSFTIAEMDGLHRGTRIIVELKDDAEEYAQKWKIESIIKQYSSFVSFPIKLEGEKVNTVQALWTRNRNEITEEEYTEFYKFIGNATNDALYKLHFSADAPLAINALLFVPEENFEILGFGRVEPGVNLYCQRILIDQHSENILPEWLRFLKGVVDSEDLPLNISRQALQDNALVAKLRKVIITKRFLKYLDEQAGKDPELYEKFWSTFGIYLKEGVTSDYEYQKELGKLLRFESSKSEAGKMVSLSDYMLRINPDQEEIYYINGPSRAAIEAGPYVEMFRKKDIEIIYTLEPIDDFVLSHLGEFDGKKLVSADRADLSLAEDEEGEEARGEEGGDKLDEKGIDTLIGWMKKELEATISDVVVSKRLVDAPAMIVNPDGFMSSSMERILAASRKEHGMGLENSKKKLEINPKNPLIIKLAELHEKDGPFAAEVAKQIHDNAMIQAGLVVDPLQMVERNYKILGRVLGN